MPSQNRPIATVKLTAPAPAGNAVIALESNNTDVAKVPASVSVSAGATTATFEVETSTVRNPTTVIIEARYLGVAARASLTVNQPTLGALFKINSATRGEDACGITSAAGAVDCVFDGSPSPGFPSTYRWTITLGGKELVVNTSAPAFTPSTDCAFLSGGDVSSEGTVPVTVSLRVEDRQGATAGPTVRTIRLFPNSMCGY